MGLGWEWFSSGKKNKKSEPNNNEGSREKQTNTTDPVDYDRANGAFTTPSKPKHYGTRVKEQIGAALGKVQFGPNSEHYDTPGTKEDRKDNTWPGELKVENLKHNSQGINTPHSESPSKDTLEGIMFHSTKANLQEAEKNKHMNEKDPPAKPSLLKSTFQSPKQGILTEGEAMHKTHGVGDGWEENISDLWKTFVKTTGSTAIRGKKTCFLSYLKKNGPTTIRKRNEFLNIPAVKKLLSDVEENQKLVDMYKEASDRAPTTPPSAVDLIPFVSSPLVQPPAIPRKSPRLSKSPAKNALGASKLSSGAKPIRVCHKETSVQGTRSGAWITTDNGEKIRSSQDWAEMKEM